jgi:hypothetical protein
MDRESLGQMLGRGLSLAQIGRRLGRHEATVAYRVKAILVLGSRRTLLHLWLRPQHARAGLSSPAAGAEGHEINAKGVAIALDKLRVKARKCVLLCSNCHAEVEDGMTMVPADALRPPPG